MGTVVIGDYFGLSKPDYGFVLIAKGKAKMDYTFECFRDIYTGGERQTEIEKSH